MPAGSLDVAMYAAPIVIDPIAAAAAAAAASQFAVTLDAIAADVVDWWGPGNQEPTRESWSSAEVERRYRPGQTSPRGPCLRTFREITKLLTSFFYY